MALANHETENIVATGAILADVLGDDGIDIDQIRTGDRLKVDADEGLVESV